MKVSTETKSRVISEVLKQLRREYIFPEIAAQMETAIRSHAANGGYADIMSAQQLAERLQSDLRSVSKDQHLEVVYSHDAIPIENANQEEKINPERAARIRYKGGLVNYWFKSADVFPGNIGYLRFDGFFPLKDGGRDTADAAMAFLQHTSALIIDLRQNRGGDPAVGLIILGYLFDERVHLGDFLSRPDDSKNENIVSPHSPGARYSGDVYVLVSRETISAAEGFAYDLQSVRRAVVIGERTAGAAHPAFEYRVGEHFMLTIPTSRYMNAVTGTDWEGTGVVPDVSVPPDNALHTAELTALGKLLKEQPDYPFIEERKRALQELQKAATK
ncbi:MAG: S41 family peptidase [Acidobacteriaceae bacterium]|nr:S41 family peptidase [Acidobacteriaceae bacterium]MBV9781663.1 S41 family peptidase [Acidobacteriaceae bacterium]